MRTTVRPACKAEGKPSLHQTALLSSKPSDKSDTLAERISRASAASVRVFSARRRPRGRRRLHCKLEETAHDTKRTAGSVPHDWPLRGRAPGDSLRGG